MVYCRTLGPVEVTIHGSAPPAALLWRKHLGLLLYLACSPRRTRGREHLIGLLWGDKPESAARHSLNEALRVLRRCCGDNAIEATVDQVRLSAESVRLDCDDFEACESAGDWAGAARLVAGDFLEGFAIPDAWDFGEWHEGQKRAWRQRSVGALYRHGAELLALGDVGQAAAVGQRALDLDPLSGAACRLTMRSLALSGARATALECYDAFEERLRKQLGIEPDDETRGLAARVRQERVYRTAGLPGAVDVRSRAGPLVGREAELNRILQVWDTCRTEQRAALVLVQGDSGSGKTRLLDEIVNRARLDDAATFVIRAVETDAAVVDSGVLTLLRSIDPESSPEAGALVPAMRHVVKARAAVVGIDAAHWLDRSSLLALQPLLRDLAAAPIMLVLTLVRHPVRMEIDSLRARIGRELDGTAVSLGGLSHDAIRTLARWTLPEWDAVQLDRVARRLALDSAGVPLLAVELLHAIRHGLDLGTLTSAWPEPLHTLSQTMPGQLPDALTAALRVGFRKLSDGARDVLIALAVLGERADTGALARATERPTREVDDALDELEWQRWITSEPRGYAFTARIVRDVVLRDMVSSTRRNRMLANARVENGR